MQRMNVKQCLLRHDWVYRWEAILKTVGLEPMPKLSQRKKILRNLAEVVGHNETCPVSETSRDKASPTPSLMD
jgi:hypothetical protein